MNVHLAFITMMSDKKSMKNESACIKYKSHIVQTAGNEQTPAKSVFIHIFVYWSGDILFVSKNEHNSGSWYSSSNLKTELYVSPLKIR